MLDRPYGPVSQVVTPGSGASAFQRRFRAAAARPGILWAAAKRDPAITFTAIDDRGQEQQSITFRGTFSLCDDSMPPKQFMSGKTYQSCLASAVFRRFGVPSPDVEALRSG